MDKFDGPILDAKSAANYSRWLSHLKQPEPKRPEPIDVPDFQRKLHAVSAYARLRNKRQKGAFGGCTRGERYERVVKRRVGK